ncbi:OsmC family protein [Bacteroidota bacterium]
MKKDTINLKWMDGMSFEADIEGYKIQIDSDPEFGGQGKGPKPKPLMMVALAGCTGMDLVSLLNKMRVEYDSLNIVIEGEITEEHPKHFKKMKVIYEISGNNVDLGKVEKAVAMSNDRYCGVSHSYKQAMEIEHEIKII